MGDFGDAISNLYEKFILRDLLSFITPGAIVVLTALLLFLPIGELFELSRSMHWLLYIPLFGLFFISGFAIQCAGEFLGIIHFSPPDKYHWDCKQRLKILLPFGWSKEKDNMWWVNYYKDILNFWESTATDDTARQARERLIVLKQMCANGSLAIFIAGILLLVNNWVHLASLVLFFIVTASLLLSLFWGYRVHVLRQYAREQASIRQWKES